ncbi:hypothetical protein [Pararhizobium antarcticum]|uniref:Fimbrial protein n=1 Tax=Pararhizobium antarcticum TaxID=1798805 RepID=A0A657LM66_9HYPH|nr:hypothetical protein [Pararhizobium antarcticum]OJF92242.1 hypothetical protein AX760_05840 [Pararhizobium antarcticum]OJF94876.1 hypothetical protein AX761_04465 [Rhizobium sp. 58]
MSQQVQDGQEEKPLDPAMENVRRKMIKLQVVSVGVMLVMLMAVLGTIVYKVTRPSGGPSSQASSASVPSDAPVAGIAALPAGFTVSDVALADGQILFYGSLAGGERKAFVVDIANGRIVADILVKTN